MVVIRVPIPSWPSAAGPAQDTVNGFDEIQFSSISGLLCQRAREQPERLAFRFLPEGTSDNAIDWTYYELAVNAAAVASALRERDLKQRRVVLALDPGLT